MSATNAHKTPFARSLNEFADRKTTDAAQLAGKRLPCQVVKIGTNGATVTVKILVNSPFTLPQIVVPVQESVYQRLPIQVNDLGYLTAADTRLGNVTGLGGSTPDLTTPANLACLVYVPVGNANWTTPPDLNSHVIAGPNGVSLWDIGRHSTLILTPNGIALVGQTTMSFQVGSTTMTIDNTGVTINGNVNITGAVVASGEGTFNGGHTVSGHRHGGVTAGGAQTNTPTG